MEKLMNEIAEILHKHDCNAILFANDGKQNGMLASENLDPMIPFITEAMKEKSNILTLLTECVIRLMLENKEYKNAVLKNFFERDDATTNG